MSDRKLSNLPLEKALDVAIFFAWYCNIIWCCNAEIYNGTFGSEHAVGVTLIG